MVVGPQGFEPNKRKKLGPYCDRGSVARASRKREPFDTAAARGRRTGRAGWPHTCGVSKLHPHRAVVLLAGSRDFAAVQIRMDVLVAPHRDRGTSGFSCWIAVVVLQSPNDAVDRVEVRAVGSMFTKLTECNQGFLVSA